MDIKNRKIWIIIVVVVILGLVSAIVYQNYKIKDQDRVLKSYEHNSINAYKYLMSITDFKPAIQDMEEIYSLEELDDETLLEVSNSFGKIIDHLMQLNVLRGYSDDDYLLKENATQITNFSYIFIYGEQEEYNETINNIYLNFDDLLIEIYQEGLHDEHKELIEDIVENLTQIEGTMKSSINRHLDPNDLSGLRMEYKRIEPLLDELERVFHNRE